MNQFFCSHPLRFQDLLHFFLVLLRHNKEIFALSLVDFFSLLFSEI